MFGAMTIGSIQFLIQILNNLRWLNVDLEKYCVATVGNTTMLHQQNVTVVLLANPTALAVLLTTCHRTVKHAHAIHLDPFKDFLNAVIVKQTNLGKHC